MPDDLVRVPSLAILARMSDFDLFESDQRQKDRSKHRLDGKPMRCFNAANVARQYAFTWRAFSRKPVEL
jgi:hypothetical protein